MPRKTTSKKQPNTEMFPPIGQDIDINGTSNEPSVADQIKALTDSVTTLSNEVKAGKTREERLQTLVTSLAAGNRSADQTVVPAQVPQGVDLSKLPDPTKDVEGFKRGLQQQVSEAISTNVAASVTPMRRQQEQEAKLAALWQKFTAKHKDLADYQDLAESIATRMVQAAVRSGMNAERFVYGVDDGDTFIDTVAEGLHERLNAIRGGKQGEATEEDEEGDEGTVTDPQGRQVPRTLGLDAGTGEARLPTQPQGRNQNTKPTTLIDELKEAQSRAHIY